LEDSVFQPSYDGHGALLLHGKVVLWVKKQEYIKRDFRNTFMPIIDMVNHLLVADWIEDFIVLDFWGYMSSIMMFLFWFPSLSYTSTNSMIGLRTRYGNGFLLSQSTKPGTRPEVDQFIFQTNENMENSPKRRSFLTGKWIIRWPTKLSIFADLLKRRVIWLLFIGKEFTKKGDFLPAPLQWFPFFWQIISWRNFIIAWFALAFELFYFSLYLIRGVVLLQKKQKKHTRKSSSLAVGIFFVYFSLFKGFLYGGICFIF